MKIVKIMKQHENGMKCLESPTYYSLPSDIADEMAKYKSYYHYLYYKDLLDDGVLNRIFDEEPSSEDVDYVLDFREEYKNLDITIMYNPTVLSDYIEENSHVLDKYGAKLHKEEKLKINEPLNERLKQHNVQKYADEYLDAVVYSKEDLEELCKEHSLNLIIRDSEIFVCPIGKDESSFYPTTDDEINEIEEGIYIKEYINTSNIGNKDTLIKESIDFVCKEVLFRLGLGI